jgi:hypothetical protein
MLYWLEKDQFDPRFGDRELRPTGLIVHMVVWLKWLYHAHDLYLYPDSLIVHGNCRVYGPCLRLNDLIVHITFRVHDVCLDYTRMVLSCIRSIVCMIFSYIRLLLTPE